MKRFLVDFKAPSQSTGRAMTNRRIVRATSLENAVIEFVKLGFDKSCITTVWQEALINTITVTASLKEV